MSQTRLGAMLRLYRTVRGKTLRQVAPQIGIGHATLLRIETGKAMDADTLLKLWAWLLQPDGGA
jgi:transcriptional regulator with XRE-family HTH domain